MDLDRLAVDIDLLRARALLRPVTAAGDMVAGLPKRRWAGSPRIDDLREEWTASTPFSVVC